MATTDSTSKALRETLAVLRCRQANLFVAGAEHQIVSYGVEIDLLQNLSDRYEAALATRLAGPDPEGAPLRPLAAEMRAALPGNSALVDFVRYVYQSPGSDLSTPHYLAVVLDGSDAAHMIDLGEAKETDDLVQTYRRHMEALSRAAAPATAKDKRAYNDIASRLYRRILSPLDPYLSGKHLLLIAPDGCLSLISFAGLRNAAGRYLIEGQVIRYLSAGRDLLQPEYSGRSGYGLFALGDPDYDATISERADSLSGQTLHASLLTHMNRRSSVCSLSSLRGMPLPGARSEVETIARWWKQNSQEPVLLCLGPQASEECFKRNAAGKRVIHMSVHGFYLEPSRAEGLPERWAASPVQPELIVPEENPLLRSGLLLAGASFMGESADSLGAEDGVLTALEVSGMDLRGTELVVLSACETGLGDVAQGEGVYGLRRAFQIAGARTVVSALWPVDDAGTAEMMASLYNRRGGTLAEAMRRVQLERLSELRRAGLPDHPFTWAAFIATGDWK